MSFKSSNHEEHKTIITVNCNILQCVLKIIPLKFNALNCKLQKYENRFNVSKDINKC